MEIAPTRVKLAVRQSAYAIFVTLICITVMGPMKIAVISAHNDPIPKTGFQSWTLFLVCAPDWAMPDKSKDLANLYRQFNAFGDAIGDHNAAVWFWKKTMPLNSTALVDNIDIARSAGYCGELRLRPSKGPFLLVTTSYPNIDALPVDRAVYELGQLPPSKITEVLNKLTDDLVTKGKPTPTEDQPSSGLWVRLLENAQQTITSMGCAVTVKINAGVVNAEIKGCAQ